VSAQERIAEVVAGVEHGRPAARKLGRNPRFPYVPVLVGSPGGGLDGVEQILGLAFATREEAVWAAERTVGQRRAALARHLAEPRHRAAREHYGLPRELADLEAAG